MENSQSLKRPFSVSYLPVIFFVLISITAIFNEWAKFLIIYVLLITVFILFIKNQTSSRFGLSSDESRFVLCLFIIALIIRIVTASAFHFHSVIIGQNGFYFSDDITYDKDAREMIDSFHSNKLNLPRIMFISDGYHFFYQLYVFSIYYLIGVNILYVIFINCAFSSLIVVFVYLIARQAYNKDVAKTSAYIVTFDLLSIYWGSFLLKDIFISFLSYFVLYLWSGFEGLKKHRLAVNLIVPIILVIILFTRIYSALSFILVAVISFLAKKLPEEPSILPVGIVTMLTLVFLATLGVGYAINRSGFLDKKIVSKRDPIKGQTRISPKEAVRSFFSKEGLETLARFLYTPMAWKYEFEKDSLLYYSTYPFMWLMYLLIPLIFSGFLYSLLKRPVETVQITSFTVISSLSLLFLIHAPDRQRTFVMPALYMLSAAGYNCIKNKRIIIGGYLILFGFFILFEQKMISFIPLFFIVNVIITALYLLYDYFFLRKNNLKSTAPSGA